MWFAVADLTFAVAMVVLLVGMVGLIIRAERRGRKAYEARQMATASDSLPFRHSKAKQRADAAWCSNPPGSNPVKLAPPSPPPARQRQGNHDDDLLLGLIAGWFFFGKH